MSDPSSRTGDFKEQNRRLKSQSFKLPLRLLPLLLWTCRISTTHSTLKQAEAALQVSYLLRSTTNIEYDLSAINSDMQTYLRIDVDSHPSLSGLIGQDGMRWTPTNTSLGIARDIAWRSGPANLYAITSTKNETQLRTEL